MSKAEKMQMHSRVLETLVRGPKRGRDSKINNVNHQKRQPGSLKKERGEYSPRCKSGKATVEYFKNICGGVTLVALQMGEKEGEKEDLKAQN